MRIFIEDHTARHQGLPEVEIKADESIRFEFGNNKISFKFDEEGITAYKINDHGLAEESRISIIPMSSNKILIK